jgi:hypothetical protein
MSAATTQNLITPNNACTGRLVGLAKKANLGEQSIPFRELALSSRR